MASVGKKTFKLLFFLLLVSCQKEELSQSEAKEEKQVNKIDFSIGTNLSLITDYYSGFAFTDAFKQAREWVSLSKDKWGDGRDIIKDKNGWVKLLQLEQRAATLIFTDLKGTYPSGIYTLKFKGEGKFRIYGSGFVKIVNEKPGEKQIELDANKGGIIIEITETNFDNYLRDFHFYFPGGVCSDDATQYCDGTCNSGAKCLKFPENNITFHPFFLKNISPYSTLRFLDWMMINNSKQDSWESRPKQQDYTWTISGIPLEIMIELANLTNKNPWFCIPHLADDNYVKNFAKTVKAKLKPELKVFLEYSNEVWNMQFEQAKYAKKMGEEIFAQENAREIYYALRADQIFEIWSEFYQEDSNLINVVSAQAAYPKIAEDILEKQDYADALAIAPYFETEAEISSQILKYVNFEKIIENIRAHKKLAEDKNIELIAYEGGQHLLPGSKDNVEILKSVNRSLQMEDLYLKYLKIWKDEVDSLFVHYNSVIQCTQYGCWGAKESYLEPDELAPKYRALKSFAKKEKEL